jgi:hypothetical protein
VDESGTKWHDDSVVALCEAVLLSVVVEAGFDPHVLEGLQLSWVDLENVLIDIPVDRFCAAWCGETTLVVPESTLDWNPLGEIFPVKCRSDSSSSRWKVFDDLSQPRHVWSILILLKDVSEHSIGSTFIGIIRGQDVDCMNTEIVQLTIDLVLRWGMEMELRSFVVLSSTISLVGPHSLCGG